MRGGTHALAGVAIGAAMSGGRPIEIAVVTITAAAIGALLPDLDHPQAALSRRVGIAAAPVRLFFGHRGATHGLLAVLLAFVAALAVAPAMQLYGLAAALGYASHIVLDAATFSGVPLFWPWPRRFRVLPIRTGGTAEKVVLWLLLGGLALMYHQQIIQALVWIDDHINFIIHADCPRCL